jgi:phage shock protein C
MKKLYRSQSDRKIAGICGGLGELYEVDPNLLRLIAVLVFLVSGFFPVLVTYIIAWIIIPDGKPDSMTSQPADTPKATAADKSSTRKKPAPKKKV